MSVLQLQRGVDPPGLLGLVDRVPGPHGPGRGYASPPGLNLIVPKALRLFHARLTPRQRQRHPTRQLAKRQPVDGTASGLSNPLRLPAIQTRRVETSSAGAVRPRNGMTLHPEARRVDTSIPNISSPVLQLVLLQKVQILIFKRAAGMMRYQILSQPEPAFCGAEDNVIQELLMCTHERCSTAKRCRPSGPKLTIYLRACCVLNAMLLPRR